MKKIRSPMLFQTIFSHNGPTIGAPGMGFIVSRDTRLGMKVALVKWASDPAVRGRVSRLTIRPESDTDWET
ncbi:MAG: hypothetical protein GY950_07720 [bacterium]|nr:hypothetical protein [bacterium]